MLINIPELLCYLHFLEINKSQNGSKNVIPNRLFTAHLKVFDMANLFDRPMVLLNLPVLVMDFGEIVAFKRDLLWQVNHVVATLVF